MGELAKTFVLYAHDPDRGLNEEQQSYLQLAAVSGDVKAVARALAAGADIKRLDAKGRSASFLAAENGHVAVLETLCAHDESCLTDFKQGRSLLVSMSAAIGALDVLKFLIARKVDLYDVQVGIQTPMISALLGRQPKAAGLLLDAGYDVRVTVKDMLALHMAVQTQEYKLLERLLENGGLKYLHARPTPWGKTAFYYAIERGDVHAARTLLSYGAFVDMKDDMGWTALQNAAERNDPALLRFLVDEARADLNRTGHPTGDTPLHRAAVGGKIDNVKLLLQAGADPDVCNKDGDSALCIAARRGDHDMIKILIAEGGAASGPQNEAQRLNALCGALALSRVTVAAQLLDYYANENYKTDLSLCTKSGDNPLVVAVGTTGAGMVKALLQAGASPDSLGGVPQKRALMFAIERRNITTAFTLLKAGANPALGDGASFPLHEAVVRDMLPVLEELVKYPAIDLEQKNAQGLTALDLAGQKGRVDMLRILRDAQTKAARRTSPKAGPAPQ